MLRNVVPGAVQSPWRILRKASRCSGVALSSDDHLLLSIALGNFSWPRDEHHPLQAIQSNIVEAALLKYTAETATSPATHSPPNPLTPGTH